MEGHEVPKNVTEFEFHLVGDMTLKQFAYLATGLGSAYLIFVIAGSNLPLIAWPLMIVCALLGVAYAFLPISERPLDHWTVSFFRAIFAPTQRTWKSKMFAEYSPLFNSRLQTYLSGLTETSLVSQTPTVKPSVISQFVQLPPQKIAQTVIPQPLKEVKQAPPPIKPIQPKIPAINLKPKKVEVKPKAISLPTPSPQELKETVELAKQIQELQNKITNLKNAIDQLRTKAVNPTTTSPQIVAQLKKAQLELQNLEAKESKLSHDLAVLSKTPEVFHRQKIIVPTKEAPKGDIKLVLTTTPNIINGIVTDSQGNYLEGVIVVTHDKQNMPVRALKSNKLGQFLAATPLPNGTYTVTLEKDNLVFDDLEVKLEGQVLPPIRVSAKKGGIN